MPNLLRSIATEKITCSGIFTARKRSAKVMFLHVSVCPQGRGIPACLADGIPACLTGLQGCVCVYPCMSCRFPGPHPRGSLRGLAKGISRFIPRGVHPSMHWCRPPQLMATTAGGTHPTGMHSCQIKIFYQVFISSLDSRNFVSRHWSFS